MICLAIESVCEILSVAIESICEQCAAGVCALHAFVIFICFPFLSLVVSSPISFPPVALVLHWKYTVVLATDSSVPVIFE